MDRTTFVLDKIAENIRVERARQRITQEELAHKAGINRTYMGDIERGGQNLSLLKLCAIADALGVLPASLLDGINLKNSAELD